ncbi:TetR/AcrR family transcriptional regulator, partial [Rhizobium leguminosarum bv. phaseoli]|nr:TetR/AcrR family transcriptional regulator [Rhizobium leguminosarum bv. phaseoli]
MVSPASAPSSTSPAPVPSPRRARRKDARPGELIDAALDLFVE